MASRAGPQLPCDGSQANSVFKFNRLYNMFAPQTQSLPRSAVITANGQSAAPLPVSLFASGSPEAHLGNRLQPSSRCPTLRTKRMPSCGRASRASSAR